MTKRNKERERHSKPHSPHYRANNDGGFGNPPVKDQFQDGNPGGPGRPKGKTNLESALRKALKRRRPVSREGKTIRMSPVDVFAERVVETILSRTKSPALLEFGRQIFEQYGPESLSKESDANSKGPDLSGLSMLELEMYGYLAWRLETLNGEEPVLDSHMKRIFKRFEAVVKEEKELRESRLASDVDDNL